MSKVAVVITGILVLTDVNGMQMDDLGQHDDLEIRHALGAVGLDSRIFKISKRLKNSDANEYLQPKLTYIEMVFAGYG